MPVDLYTNSAQTQLTQPVTTTPAAGSLEVWTVSTTGPFPQIGTAGLFQFRAVVNLLTDPDPEIVLVQQINSSTTMTVARGAEGSPIKTHAINDTVVLSITAGGLASLAPSGTVEMFAGTTPPQGWLPCDGRAISRTTYLTLFQTIGTTWGAGDGSTTFNIPDLRGRVPVGSGSGLGLTARTLGSYGGEEFHRLSASEMPIHSHPINDQSHGHTISDGQHGHGFYDPSHNHGAGPNYQFIIGFQPNNNNEIATQIGTGNTTYEPATAPAYTGGQVQTNWTGVTNLTSYTGITGTNLAGSGNSHNNMQPFAVLTYIIRL
jgi:microcystin-dependent protein